MSIEGIMRTVMNEIIHPSKIEIIDDLTKAIGITMIEGPMTIRDMKLIDHIIIAFRTTEG